MPDVATARLRTVAITGGGGFGVDNANVFRPVPGTTRHRWDPNSTVTYWGVPVGAYVTCDEHWSSGSASCHPSITLTIFRGAFSKSVTVTGTAYTGTTSINHLDIQYFDASAGSFTFTETANCVQHFGPVGGVGAVEPYEAITPVNFFGSATISVSFVDTEGAGSQTVTASVNLSDSEIPSFTSGTYSAAYDYSFAFSGIAVHYDISANIAFDSPGLISTRTGINTHYGKPQLTGTGSSITFHWDGVAADINQFWGGEPGYPQPAATIRFAPSWALSVAASCYRYKDAAAVATGLQHYYGTFHVGDFAAGTAYRYPASGLIDYLILDQFLTGQQNSGDGFQAGTITPPTLTLTGADYSPVGRLLQVPGQPLGALTQFRVDPAWANAYPTYSRSYHPVPNPYALGAKLWQPFQQGTIAWASTHKFGLFESNTGPRWLALGSAPDFAGAAAFDSDPAIALVSGAGLDGSALEVTTTGSCAVSTGTRYLLRHQGYRYAHLRLKATGGGGKRVLFVLAGVPGTFAWSITVTADGSLQTLELDLAKPGYRVSGGAWIPNSDLVPPSAFFPDPAGGLQQGATVTVQPLDASTWTFDYLEGFYKTDGTRTPRLLFPFLDGRGAAWGLEAYEDNTAGAWSVPGPYDQADVMRAFVNGVEAFLAAVVTVGVGALASIDAVWTHLIGRLDSAANDTGITVVRGVAGDPDVLAVFGPLNMGQFAFDALTGYGLKPAADSPLALHGQLRTDPASCGAYPGAGDLMATSGGYSEVISMALDWVWQGEVLVSMAGDLSAPPVLALADNDTGATISSGSPDSDGFLRLPGPYGVVRPRDNVDQSQEWIVGPPFTWTALGKQLNADWLNATNVNDPVDGSGYVQIGSPLARRLIVLLDRYQTVLYLHGAAVITGVDLTTSLVGVHIVCYLDGRPVVKTTRDAGATWDMADLADHGDTDSLPTIHRDRRDRLYVWDHTTASGTPNAVLFRSHDYGAAWEHLGAVITGLKFPRMASGLTRHFVAAHNGDTIAVYGSTAESMVLGTWESLSTVAAPMQLVGFRSDRRGWLHLVYVDGVGTIVQRISRDGITWSDPAVAIEAASVKPAAAFGMEKALVVLWTGSTLYAQPVKADLLNPDGAPVTTGLTLPVQYVGLESDRREHYWLAGQLAGALLLVAYSQHGTDWLVLP